MAVTDTQLGTPITTSAACTPAHIDNPRTPDRMVLIVFFTSLFLL